MPNPEAMAATMTASILLATFAGALNVRIEWNRLLSDYGLRLHSGRGFLDEYATNDTTITTIHGCALAAQRLVSLHKYDAFPMMLTSCKYRIAIPSPTWLRTASKT